jgi:hypothetical protein
MYADKYAPGEGQADDDSNPKAHISIGAGQDTNSSKELSSQGAGAAKSEALGRVGSPKAAAAAGKSQPGAEGPQNPPRTRPTTIVLPKSAAALLSPVQDGQGASGAKAAATRAGPKTRAQQLAMIEKELKEIRTNLQVDGPAGDGQKGADKKAQSSTEQSSSLSSGDNVNSNGSDWIQAGAALVDHIPGLMLTAVLG